MSITWKTPPKPTIKVVEKPDPPTLAGYPIKFVNKPGTLGVSGPMILGTLDDMRPPQIEREQLFDKAYFNGGGKVGGYAREGYWDYPVHEVTARHILARHPESVLELGCARGYILKRLQDKGVPALGMEISKHCYMTRVASGILQGDMCQTPWTLPSVAEQERTCLGASVYTLPIDLCYSVATLEHIPENFLPSIIGEMVRCTKRGLHGVDFGANDDGFDKTHCTLRPYEWWRDLFNKLAPGYPVEIVDKQELEQGFVPPEVLRGDGKLKLNIGSFTTMFHHGWINLDIFGELHQFAQQHGYRYQQCDVRGGMPYPTESVDLIMSCHMLEHLTYEEGIRFLRECRRVLKPTGAMRILVPDARMLCNMYAGEQYDGSELAEFDEINDGCAQAPTLLGKLWALLHAGHSAAYDDVTLTKVLELSGFKAYLSDFRGSPILYDDVGTVCNTSFAAQEKQILAETLDMLPCLTLYMMAVPDTGA
jgi:SAM-dependent methyltransferase